MRPRKAHVLAPIALRKVAGGAQRFVYEPETNGVVEKFLQTLKEQVLWIERFDTLEQLRARVRQFARDYNEHWLLARHGYRSPHQARAALTAPDAALA